jgi:hypothetical protein
MTLERPMLRVFLASSIDQLAETGLAGWGGRIRTRVFLETRAAGAPFADPKMIEYLRKEP